MEFIMTSTLIYSPFTYCVTFIPTGQKYYGVRYAKNCHPTTLWKSYFTSSTTIHKLINTHGIDAFTCEIRKLFTTAKDAVLYEHKFLTKINAAANPYWFNNSNGGKTFCVTPESSAKSGLKHRGKIISVETRQKMSVALSGKRYPNRGAMNSETKQKISQSLIGIKKPPKTIFCSFCKKDIIGASNASRWHLDNCKKNPAYVKPVNIIKIEISCPYCNKTSTNRLSMMRFHFDKCKYK